MPSPCSPAIRGGCYRNKATERRLAPPPRAGTLAHAHGIERPSVGGFPPNGESPKQSLFLGNWRKNERLTTPKPWRKRYRSHAGGPPCREELIEKRVPQRQAPCASGEGLRVLCLRGVDVFLTCDPMGPALDCQATRHRMLLVIQHRCLLQDWFSTS